MKTPIVFLFLFTFVVNRTTLFVFEVFRHGARAPEKFFNNARREDYVKHRYSVRAGMLTLSGAIQHFLLGTELRKRYVTESQFLSPMYNPDEITVICSTFPRTYDSALSHLLGLYPTTTYSNISTIEEMINKEPFIWKNPLNILSRYHIKPHNFEIKISQPNKHLLNICSSFCAGKKDIKFSQEIRQALKDYVTSHFYPELLSETNFKDWADLTNHLGTLMIDINLSKLDGFELPQKMREAFVDTGIVDKYFKVKTEYLMHASKDEKSSRIEVSNLFKLLFGKLHKKMKINLRSDKEKMVIISGHDTQLVTIQKVLRLVYDFEFKTPKLASNIIVELYEENEVFLIDVELDGTVAIRDEVHFFIAKVSRFIYSDEEIREFCGWDK